MVYFSGMRYGMQLNRAMALATTLRWVMMLPFGFPVVPEV